MYPPMQSSKEACTAESPWNLYSLRQLSMLTAAQSATTAALELQQASPGIPVQARQRPTCTPEPASTLSLSVERSASYCQASRHDVMAGRRHNA
mmetsp:Transcript_3260/g.7061  ORF Transcript_3260/g.7061 Transcript_3260/m.7061 type:complete len:94 (-) Transcript_3260:26-307(-)